MQNELVNRNKNINRGFRKLKIWNEAIILYSLIHGILKIQIEIPFKIKAQIEDACLSISSNIAEGYPRRSIKETLRFYEISLSSAAENYLQFFALFSAGQITQSMFDEVDSKLYELENKIIRMNQSLIEKISSESEWNTDYQTTNLSNNQAIK